MEKNIYKDMLFGIAVGDALGLPVEFISREEIAKNPITGMTGYGSHNQPPGTFSDDTSMSCCTAESLLIGYNLYDMAQRFCNWLYDGYWTAHKQLTFDSGSTTRNALWRFLKKECTPEICGGFNESENGNGSLMRILPMLFYLKNKDINDRWNIIKDVSSITHANITSIIACFYYIEFAISLLKTKNKILSYSYTKMIVNQYLSNRNIEFNELSKFNNLLYNDIELLPVENINSSGYTLHTLEASIWCLMTTDNYKDCVLKAVNLGEDSDSTGAVAGGLAGLVYGYDTIPKDWIDVLYRKDDIEDLANRLYNKEKENNK